MRSKESGANMLTFNTKDRDLFFKIAKDIKRCPDKYRAAGEWLNQYYDGYDESYWMKRRDELAHYLECRQRDGKVKYISDKIKVALRHSAGPVTIFRLVLALEDLMKDYEGCGVMDENCARALLIIAWLATDPEVDKSHLSLTKFANLPWKTKGLMSKGYSTSEPTRYGLAPFLFAVFDLALHHDYQKYGQPIYELNLVYLPAIRTAWAKIEAEKDLESEKPAKKEKKIKPVKEILLDSIRSAYMEFERLSEKPLNLDGLTSEEIAYAEAAVIEYLTERFGEEDDEHVFWPRDWGECPEAFELYKAKIREYRELKTKASLEQVKSIAEAQTTKKPTQTTQEMNKDELRKVEVAKEFVSVVDEALQLISQTDDLNTTLRSEQVQNLAAKIKVLGQECGLLEEYQKVGLDANSYYQQQYAYDTCFFFEELGNFEWSVPKELRLLREKAKLFVNKTPAETKQEKKAGKVAKAVKRGRPKKYTDEQRKKMRDMYNRIYQETNDSKGALNKVADFYGVVSGDAVKAAFRNLKN